MPLTAAVDGLQRARARFEQHGTVDAMTVWFIESLPERPDFRLIAAFLFGEPFNIDSDGDSDSPASHCWTWLYLRNRQRAGEQVDIEVEGDAAARTRVQSGLSWLAAAAAFFLATEGATRVRSESGDDWVSPTLLEGFAGEFDLQAAVARARASIWRQATLANPYPNLERG